MRSTGKCDIILSSLTKGIFSMKTKIIYISGNEIFDMNDIRAAFEEVRIALNLDKNTVLFGVPVDSEDAGLSAKTDELPQTEKTIKTHTEIEQKIPETEISTPEPEIIPEPIDEIIDTESVVEQPVKKRGRPRKETVIETVETVETIADPVPEPIMESDDSAVSDDKVVPILSVLSTKDEENVVMETEIIPEISEEIVTEPTDENADIQQIDEDADLEKLLSAMTPLDESTDPEIQDTVPEEPVHEDISVDATLEQLATEFAENQDKIASETKSSARNRIGKLRNILPFKQSKHKDTGLGDLFGWAGIAANDEDFSVPGFFTNAASRK